MPRVDTHVGNGNTMTLSRPSHDRPLKLSWPRKGDRRRAVVAEGHTHFSDTRSLVYDLHMIHVTDRDMIVHYNAPKVNQSVRATPDQARPIIDRGRKDWKRLRLQPMTPVNTLSPHLDDAEMMEHFQNVASRALPAFGIDPMQLGRALVRIAGLDSSHASLGLTKLIQSFAVIQKYSVHEQMMNLKIEALSALGASSKHKLSPTAAMQHLAAGMMLCSIEIHHASCTTGQWLIHLCGVKKIQRSGSLPEPLPGSDLEMLLHWAYYVDVVARFSYKHWSDPFAEGPCPMSQTSPAALRAERPAMRATSLDVIELMAEVSDATAAGLPTDATMEVRESHINYLKILEWRIQRAAGSAGNHEGSPEAQQIMQLFSSALLVYLYRANQAFLGSSPETNERIEEGFGALARVPFCDRQFPIFVFGCEARTEEQRRVILDVMARTEEAVPCRAYHYLRLILVGLWAQDDLAEGTLEYSQRLGRVLRWCTNLPAFV
ncbi:fungal specific transcription factor domain-containing protein [Sarocladium implicatum]|nr:fungal specific transcription factor domain-containing protein [Sarocladium implicatum]